MSEKLFTVREASEVLGIIEKEVIELAKKGKIPSYRLGGEFLRFPKEDIFNLKTRIKKEFNLSDDTAGFREKTYNFFYFNDFYIISFLVIAVLLGVILLT